MAKTLTAGEIAGIVIACVVGAAGIVLAIVLPLVLRPKPSPPGSTPAKSPSSSPSSSQSSSPSSSPASSPAKSLPATAINLWLPTFTAIAPSIAESFYSRAASFAAAFNNTYQSNTTGRPAATFTGFWINLATGNEILENFNQAVETAKAAGIALGAVMAVGYDPTQQFFDKNFSNFNKLNDMYGPGTFTQMMFDVQDIFAPGAKENALAVANWLASYNQLIPKAVTVVAFTGGPGVTTDKIRAEMGTAIYHFEVVGIVELYSTGSTACLPAGSGCQAPTSVSQVVQNWETGGACYNDKLNMAIPKALQNQQGTWAGFSVEGQDCTGGCLISEVDHTKKCDAGGSLSFAQFSLAQFVEIMQDFAKWAGSTPQNPLNIMVYESAFLPGSWLTSMKVQ